MSNFFVERKQCDLCGKNENEVLLSKKFSDPTITPFLESFYRGKLEISKIKNDLYEVVKCKNCGLIYQKYILNSEGMELLYDKWMAQEESLHKQQSVTHSHQLALFKEMLIVEKLVKKEASKTNVLDFGTGWGYWCMMANIFNYNTIGMELSEQRVAFAKSRGVNIAGIFDEVENESRDFINMEQVLEHLPRPLEMLKELNKKLRVGGFIRIAVPNGSIIEKKLKRRSWVAEKNAIHPLEHINCFTHKTLIKIAKEAGFEFIGQPYVVLEKKSLVSWLKGILSKYNRQYFDTVIYFRKLT